MTKTPSTSRSRPSSRAWLAALVLALAPFGAAAQEATPVLTIDQDRLFAETRLGAEALAELEHRAQELASENKEIEAALIAEEQDLTQRRSEIEPQAFRELADAFDAKVQRLRGEQDEKARDLTRSRDEARAAFFNEIAATISDIVREKGAVVVIDRRDVFLSADRIDITNEAIERINAEGGQ
jgi:Skp family chaperone for outer membrane proteins